MAGMDWFRWHHGSVTDPKFQLVARKSGASLPDVLAVWAYVLETASQAEERGNFGEVDAEALDCLFGFPGTETRTADILKAMEARGLVKDGHVSAWSKRQPKREREDNTAAERKQRQRDNDSSGGAPAVTPSHATSHQEKPRGEERREEEITPTSVGVVPTLAGDACKAMKAKGLQGVNPSHPKLTALLDAGITVDELAGAAEDAVAKRKPFAYALATAEGRRRDSVVEALPSAEKAVDPDSQPAVEAEGVRLGLGKWSGVEQWSAYFARVRTAQRSQPPSPGVH
jgi:hypothetical protein